MLAPTPRAIWLMVLGAPAMLVVAVAAPGLWAVAGAWIAGVFGLIAVDGALAARLTALRLDVDPPSVLYVGAGEPATVTIAFEAGPLPARMEVKLDANDLLTPVPTTGVRGFDGRSRPYVVDLEPRRRGVARLEAVWVRWTGPLGLLHKRRRQPLAIEIPVTPNTKWVRDEAVRLYTRDADFGVKAQLERGDGTEFDALSEFTAGMDRRAIDWKHSARHGQLLAKEFRTERNHNIVFAFDTGRLMCEPLGGAPKIDRAINAALLLAYVSLRSGDRTALFGFDARPNVASRPLQGARAFPHLQALAAQLDYSTEETNFTLALTDLAGRLERRSLVLLFTDFVDTISAELMLDTVERLSDRHLVVFATFEDQTLRRFAEGRPETAEDLGRAVIADTLLQERAAVFGRLRRLGVQILETTPKGFGPELLSRYLEIKRRDLL